MAASPPPSSERISSADPIHNNDLNPEIEPDNISQSKPPEQTSQIPETLEEKVEPTIHPSNDSVPPAEVEGTIDHRQPQDGDENNVTLTDLKAVVEEIDENLDEAIGHAADSFWNFASSVTGKVSSVVKEQNGLESFRKNVTSHLTPLGNIGRDIQTQIGTLAPDEKSIANIAGSVKSVAETVQRNAVAMEEAILATANGTSDPNTATTVEDKSVHMSVDDPGVAILPDMKANDGLDEMAAVGEKVSNALEQTVGGLWSGLWGAGDGNEQEMEQRKAKVPKTRFGKRIFELQANPDTYCEPAEDLDAFEEWGKDFNLDNHEEECIELLYTHDSIAELYERVVPRVVEENTFWMRYFFAKHTLEMEEERRKKLLERAENVVEGAEEEEDDWGDDDWDDEAEGEDKGDAVPSKESPAEDLPQDANSPRKEVAALSTPASKTAEAPKSSNANSVSSAVEPTTSDTSHKEAVRSGENEVVQRTAEVQEEDDEWGDDDWE